MFSDVRTALWHFRKGGFKQLGRFLEHKERARLLESEQADDKAKVAEESRRKLRGFDAGDFPDYVPNMMRQEPFGHYRVGVVMDDFSLMAWTGEFTLIVLTPENWRSQITEIDFLFVESAWQGNEGAWQYQVVGSAAPSHEFRSLVANCKASGTPTVFWNKEDPEHFADFIESASLFDFVGTTDRNCIELYRDYSDFDGVVFEMPFAAQVSIHNPMRDQIGSRYQIGDVCFAGTYFRHKFADRRQQMDLLISAGIEASKSLKSALTVYSRNENIDEKYAFPAPFDEWVVDALPYSKMLSAYRGYKVFLNVNTVVSSPTMFSRRALEILASGTPIVSTKSSGLLNFFNGNEIAFVEQKDEAKNQIESLVRSPFTRDRMVHKAQRKIWERHTYTHRAADILSAIGLPSGNDAIGVPKVTVVMATMRPEMLEAALEQILCQNEVELELLVATHGYEVDKEEYTNVEFHYFSKDVPLGLCLNSLIDKANGHYIAKMDDDDIYGPNYLRDQINALRYSGATVVGKQASYLYIEETDELVLRKPWREHITTDLVLGATLVAQRSLFEAIRFQECNRGEDTKFLRDVQKSGGNVYSADRFNYIQVRRNAIHTWDVSPAELKRNGKVETLGLNTKHVFVGED